MDAHAEHVLVETADGDIFCWGDAADGQCAHPGARSGIALVPEKVQGIAAPILTATVASHHTCAATSSDLFCFGSNSEYYAQRGLADATNDSMSSWPVRLPISDTHDIVQIAAGEMHTVLLTASGDVYAYGVSKWGALGLETGSGTEFMVRSPRRVDLPAGSRATKICAGGTHTCVLVGTTELYCFGENKSGECGQGHFNQVWTPSRVSFPDNVVVEIADIACGFTIAHTLVVSTSGTLYGFGANYVGT